MLNYTTTIPAAKTIGEVQELLRQAGASAIMVEYNDDNMVEALSFKIKLEGFRFVSFRLPSDYAPTQRALEIQRKKLYAAGKRGDKIKVDDQHARDVTWRVLKDWIEAQLALIEAQQATLAQVFLPYARTADGVSVYEYIAKNNQLLLGE